MPWAGRIPLDRARTINTACKLAPSSRFGNKRPFSRKSAANLWLPSASSVLSTDACPGLWRDSRIAVGSGLFVP